MTQEKLLEVSDLSIDFATDEGVLNVVDRLSFDVSSGEVLGLVGESGCGKSVTALTIMGLLPRPSGRVTRGRITLSGLDFVDEGTDLGAIRGNRIAMVFQEPMTALNPVQRIGAQLIEAIALHDIGTPDGHRARAIELLARVGIPAPDQRFKEYPHQLSGGMRQRVMIAIALASRPELLIADEPTTALDVTIQAQILDLLLELQADYGLSIIFITHDLGVIAEIASRVVVMYAGRIAEEASTTDLFRNAHHPYTRGLIDSIPRMESVPKSVLPTIEGIVPSLADMPPGCRFRNRCSYASDVCAEEPALTHIGRRRFSCHHPLGSA